MPMCLGARGSVRTSSTCICARWARLKSGQIGTGVGFGIALAPDFLGSEHLVQVALALLLGAQKDQRRPDAVDRQRVGAVNWKSQPQRLVLVDRLLDDSGAAAAPFFGPMQRDVTGVVEPAMVFEQALPAVVAVGAAAQIVTAAEYFRLGALQERAQRAAEFLLLRCVIEIHWSALANARALPEAIF